MKKLRLRFDGGEDDDAALDILPQNMQSMKKLQSLELFDYRGVSLPNCICQFQNLKKLHLESCMKLKELPALEIGNEAARGGFPMLEKLHLQHLDSLESIVWNANTMLQLQILKISDCRVLKTFRVEELPGLRELYISDCAELKEFSMESGGGLPMLETLTLRYLHSLESIVWNANTMLQLQILKISDCRVLKTFRVEELPNLRELNIYQCPELKELSMESGGGVPMLEIGNEAARGGFPMLEKLDLRYLDSLESIVWNTKTMLQLQILKISDCRVLKTFRVEELPNLRELNISSCAELKELFMESGGGLLMLETLKISYCRVLKTFRVEELPNLKEIRIEDCPELEVEIGSVPMLKKLSLRGLKKSESIAKTSSVWNKETMAELEVIKIMGCPLLRRLPMEMDKLPKLKEIVGEVGWWEGINWENDNVKIKLSHLFRQKRKAKED